MLACLSQSLPTPYVRPKWVKADRIRDYLMVQAATNGIPCYGLSTEQIHEWPDVLEVDFCSAVP